MNGMRLIVVGLCALGLSIGARGEARTLEHERIIDAPVEDVWDAFTTTEGVEKWMCVKGEVDFRVGGRYRTTYHPEEELGGPHTIVNRILAYEPMRMIAMRNVGAPDSFEWTEMFQQTWSVVRFEPIGEDRTRVSIAGHGYGEGEEWDALYAFFESGNDIVLAELQGLFASEDRPTPEQRDEAAMELARRLVGGHWVSEARMPDGSTFLARNTLTLAPDGRSVIAEGWLGSVEAGLHRHGATQVWRSPRGGGVWFQNINEEGDVARGVVTKRGEDVLHWDWRVTGAEGRSEAWEITMTFEGEDAYVMRMKPVVEDGDLSARPGIRFERVEEVGEKFEVEGGREEAAARGE